MTPPVDDQEPYVGGAAVRRTERLVLAEDYWGYDPYDALCSPLFRLPVLRRRLPRRAAQQLLRRLPFNPRPLLGIAKGQNPVTLGLALQAWSLLATVSEKERPRYASEAERLVARLDELRSPGWSGACWGYDFAWETRDTTFPRFTPTVVATGFVTHGLFTAHVRLGTPGAIELCESACSFVRNDLHRTPGPEGSFCWSYSPLDTGRVLNATAKGSRLLVEVASARGREDLLADARASLAYVVRHQRPDGSWPYAVDDPRSWADNFHTGYVLDALAAYTEHAEDSELSRAIESGWRYYRRHFFENGWVPRYYDTSLYPIDSTAVAQAMITLCRFGDVETASRIAAWSAATMQRADGGFIYRRGRHVVNRVQYMRWSTVWMLVGLATVLTAQHGVADRG